MESKSFLLCIFFFLTVHGHGQLVLQYKESLSPKRYKELLEAEKRVDEVSDSLELGELYYGLGKKSVRYNENLCLEYEIEALKIFSALQHDSLIHMVKGSLTYPLMSLGRYNEIEYNLNSAKTYWEQTQNTRWLAHTNMKFAYLERSRGNLDLAIKYGLQSYKLFREYRSISSLGNLYNDIIITYSKLGYCDHVLKYVFEYINYPETDPNGPYSRLVRHNAIKCLYEDGQDSLAAAWEADTKNMYKNSSSYKLKAYDFNELAFYKLDSLKYDEAKMYFDSSLHYFKLFDKPKYLSDAYSALSHYFEKTNQLDSALFNIDKAIVKAIESKDILQLKGLYKDKSDINFKLENYQASIEELKKSDSLRQLVFSQEKIQNVNSIDLEFEKQLNQQKIEMLEEQSKLKAKNLKYEKSIKYFLILLLIAVSIFLLLLYRLYVKKLKFSKELSIKNGIISDALKTNRTLIKEIHHRVKNNLQVVSSLLYLQSRYVKDKSAKGAISIGRSRVQAMSILHQKLYQKDDLQSVDIQEYFLDLSQNLFETYNLESKHISFSSDIDPITMDVDSVIPLGLIANELISNALKHAFGDGQKGEINLSIKQNGEQITLVVKDNGKGIQYTSIPEHTDSLGMDLIKSFCEKLDAQLHIDNSSGSRFTIHFNPKSHRIAV